MIKIGAEVKVLSGPKARTIGIVVAHNGRSYTIKAKDYVDAFKVKESNVEAYSAPDWPQEGWEAWLP